MATTKIGLLKYSVEQMEKAIKDVEWGVSHAQAAKLNQLSLVQLKENHLYMKESAGSLY